MEAAGLPAALALGPVSRAKASFCWVSRDPYLPDHHFVEPRWVSSGQRERRRKWRSRWAIMVPDDEPNVSLSGNVLESQWVRVRYRCAQ